MQDNATNTRSGLVGDSIWELRLLEDSYSIEEQLLAGVDAGLRKLAIDEPNLFLDEARSLSESKMETAQFLVARAYTANPERFADEAGEFLCAVEGRLQLSSGANPNATTTDLLKAITPHCSDKVLRNIEKKALAFYPHYEKTVDGYRQYGMAQHALLNAIASQRRSTDVKRRVGELNRKFGSPQRGRKFIEGGVVQSPISENAIDKMTDDQWLRAIRRYGSEQTRFVESGPPVGGALELSRSLEERAKSQPKRFANLLEQLPATSNPYFFQALARGISAGGPGMETVIRACEVVHAIPGTDAGRSICDAIEKLADEHLPHPAMNMIIHYATEDPDPDREWWLPDGEGRAAGYGEDPSHAGLNSTRGRAALAMAQLIRAKPERWRRLRDAVERMVCDPSVAVRSCVGRTVLAIFSIAIGLFERLTDADERLLATDHVEAFILYAIRNHYSELAPTLTRMVESPYPTVRTAGGRQLCLASLFHEEAQELLSACLTGPKDIRKGIAQVCAANVMNASHRRFCIEKLAELFDDPEEEVRDEASKVFSMQESNSLAEIREMVKPFIESAAFDKNHEYLFEALDESTVAIPKETIRASQLFLDLAGPDAGNISSGASATADHAARVILRLYQQTHDGTTKSQCLDLIDRMTDLGVYGLDKSLATVER